MASIYDSPETKDPLTSMSLPPLSQTDDAVPLQPATNEADPTSDSSSTPPHSPRPLSKARAKKVRKAQTQALSTSHPRHPPLRPANDILSRIRHDPVLNVADFIVGYQDRHADVMELPVAEWKGGGDITEEEFIPQHRILYFRRKGEEQRVWDRKERVDLIFGSGHKSGKKGGKENDKKTLHKVKAGNETNEAVQEYGEVAHDGGEENSTNVEERSRD